jgi:hypothetical protein
MIGIDPDADGCLAGPDVDTAVVKVKALLEWLSGLHQSRGGLDANPADLEQAGEVVKGISFRKQKQEVARRFDPDVGADVAVAQRHRAERVLAGRVPDNVGRQWIRRVGERGGIGCGGTGENEG